MISLIFSLLVAVGNAEIKIAVVDTGFDAKLAPKVKLCKTGHANLITGQLNLKTPPSDGSSSKHGSNVADIIANTINNQNYCVIIVKYYSDTTSDMAQEFSNQALEYVASLRINIVNYSGGGISRNNREERAVKTLLNAGTMFVAAAGNNGRLLDKLPFYPAMLDKRVIVVGALKGIAKLDASNFGSQVDVWENGFLVPGAGVRLTGSSQATAIASGKLALAMQRKGL